MPMNLSFNDWLDMLKRLQSEGIPVNALFLTSSHDKMRLRGFVRGVSTERELLISEFPQGGDGSYLAVAIPDLDFAAKYGDRREFAPVGHPATDESEVAKWGDSLLTFEFKDGSSLLLYFTL